MNERNTRPIRSYMYHSNSKALPIVGRSKHSSHKHFDQEVLQYFGRHDSGQQAIDDGASSRRSPRPSAPCSHAQPRSAQHSVWQTNSPFGSPTTTEETGWRCQNACAAPAATCSCQCESLMVRRYREKEEQEDEKGPETNLPLFPSASAQMSARIVSIQPEAQRSWEIMYSTARPMSVRPWNRRDPTSCSRSFCEGTGGLILSCQDADGVVQGLIRPC